MRRMRHFSSQNEAEASIDMSPLIDVVFILLIFFIVTTVFIKDVGVEINRPARLASSQDLEQDTIMIAVTRDGEVVYNGRNIGVEGVGAVVEALQEGGEPMPLVIVGDRQAQFGIITKVVDAATQAGVKSVSFSTQKD